MSFISHCAYNALNTPDTAETSASSRRPKLAMLSSGSRRSLLSAFQTVEKPNAEHANRHIFSHLQNTHAVNSRLCSVDWFVRYY